MIPRKHPRFLALAAAFLAFLPDGSAQCLDWRTFPYTGGLPQYTTDVALAVHDDGFGPALYIAQNPVGVTYPSFATVRRWNGTGFENVGAGLSGTIRALATFDDGSGPGLFAGGTLTLSGSGSGNIAKWNGVAWQIVSTPPSGQINAFCVHDDGSGPALYATGLFSQFTGVPVLSKWSGTSFIAFAAPISQVAGYAWSLASFDDGSGPALYVGGHFPGPGAAGTDHFVRWSNGAWSSVGAAFPTNASVLGLAVHDDGSGPALYIGGTGLANGLMRWNGTSMSTVGAGSVFSVQTLASLDLGTGAALYAGSGGVDVGVRRWDGTSWTMLSSLNPSMCVSGTPTINSFAAYDEGNGPRLFVGSSPEALGTMASSLTRRNTGVWEPVDQPPVVGLRGSPLYDLHVFDGGAGPELFACGNFCGADGLSLTGIARWNGAGWSSAGSPFNFSAWFRTLSTYDPGTGPTLIGATRYATLARFTGSTWVDLGGGTSGADTIFALQQFGSDLYLGGSFTLLNGGVASPNLARWNGSSFAPVGVGGLAGVAGAVNALATFDDGSGVALYAGGTFTSGNGTLMNRIGRWDGGSWTPLGSGMNNLVDALVVFDDGTGSALYAAGTFTNAGGVAASCVARWDGTAWSAVGAGLNAQVLSLGVFDDGSGPALYAGGNFTASGATPVSHIARWNGVAWTQVGAGVDGGVWALESFDDGSGRQLFTGGSFHHAGALPSELFATWRTCTGSGFCFGDGSSVACPCGNQGATGRGCDNSVASGGARLETTGWTNPDTVTLIATGELPNAATLVFQGDAAFASPAIFGDGLRCVSGHIKRMYTTNAVNGMVTVPGAGQPSLSARSAALGDPLLPGSVRNYQTWYRDPSPSFCAAPAGNTWNLSNAVRIVW